MSDQGKRLAQRLRSSFPEERHHPTASPEVQVAVVRREGTELRFCWSEFRGGHWLTLRRWRKRPDGTWLPKRASGLAVAETEVGDFVEAVERAAEKILEGVQPGGREGE